MAEFQELRVGVLQQLNGGFSTGLRVINEPRVPPDDGKIVGIIGDATLENLLALAFAKRGSFAADNLGDAPALRREEFFGRGSTLDLTEVKNEIILLQPVLFFVGLDQCGGGTLQTMVNHLAGQLLEVSVR